MFNNKLFKLTLSAILVSNLLDGIFTIFFTQMGLAAEANPLMKLFLDYSPMLFMLFKLFMVSIGVFILWIYRFLTFVKFGSLFVCLVYISINIWHLLGFYFFIF